jgi:hypothetical protein
MYSWYNILLITMNRKIRSRKNVIFAVKENKMKKCFLLFLIILPVLLLSPGCKALANDDNGNEEINVVGTWIFTNVLKTNDSDTHDRTFILEGDKNSGTVSEAISPTVGTYTVTGNQFKMELTNKDASFSWTYEYEGTVTDNNNMSGTSKTTTYPPDGGDIIAEYEYNFTAKRKN